jgi:hypothetical protein
MDLSRPVCLTLKTDTTHRSYPHVGSAKRRRQWQSDYTVRGQDLMRKSKGTTSLYWILPTIKKHRARLSHPVFSRCLPGSISWFRCAPGVCIQKWSIEFLASLSRISRSRLDCPLTLTVQTVDDCEGNPATRCVNSNPEVRSRALEVCKYRVYDHNLLSRRLTDFCHG